MRSFSFSQPFAQTKAAMLERLGKPLWLLTLIFLAVLLSSTIHTARGAAARTCKDIDNVTICFDTAVDLAPLLAEPSFRYEGNVTIGLKGQAALLKLTPTAVGNGIPSIIHILDGSGFGLVKFPLSVAGGLQFINEANGAPLLTTIETIEPTCPANFNKTTGAFKIDSVAAKVIVPSPSEFTSDSTIENCPILDSKPNGFRPDFLDAKGLTPFFREDSKKANLSSGTYAWDLTTRKFNFFFPINLNLNDTAENPNLQIIATASIDEQGKLTGSINSFKVRLAGLLMSATGVTLQGTAGITTTATFKAGTVKVLKVDNPDQPGFNPIDTSVILQFTNLKYSQGKWEIEGIDVGIPNLTFGSAFALKNNLLGILNETANGQNIQSIQIKSTMIFGQEGNGIPIVLRVGRAEDGNGQFKTVYQAGLQDSKIKLGTMFFNLKNATFVGNTAENFWGIKANTADLQWPANMGGQTAAGVTNFKLGINKDGKLQFGLGNGTVGLPPFENRVFRGTLLATVGVVSETMTITGTGTFTVKLPGNTTSAGVAVSAIMRYYKDVSTAPAALLAADTLQASALSAIKICMGPGNVIVACPNDPPPAVPPGPKPFELKLAGFNFKLAGFGLAVTNPRGTDDGGFAADNVGFNLPSGLNFTPNSSAGLSIQGLVVAGDGKVSISGGGIDLPTLKVGELQFNTLKGSFLQLADGNYEFAAGGKLPLPGMEPGPSSPGIAVNIKIRANLDTNQFTGAGVTVFYQAIAGTGIPIGSTGMELTGIGGSFDVNNGTLKIAVQTKASTLARIPVINLPIVTINAAMELQLNPARFTANASLTLLILQLAQAELQIGHQAGFNGGDGAHFTASLNYVVINGSVEFRAGKITVNGQPKNSLLVEGIVALGIKEKTFGPFPRQDRTLASVTITGGRFRDERDSPTRETAGVKATIDVGVQASVFLDFGETPGSGDFITFRNLDQVVRFDSVALQAARAATQISASSGGVNTLAIRDENGNAAEFSSRTLSSEEVQAAGIVLATGQEDGTAQILQESFTHVVTQTTKLAIGIYYPSGAPVLSLRLADNTVISESVNTATQSFKRTTYDDGSVDAIFTIDPAIIGSYTLLIDNAPVSYEENVLSLNLKPQAVLTSVVCQGTAFSGVTALCTGSPDNIGEAKIDWSTSDLDNPDATVSIGYALVPTNVVASEVDALNIDAENANEFIALAEGLPLGAGTYTWSFENMQSGTYKVGVMVDDGANVPVTAYSTLVIDVTDQRPPAVPSGLTAIPQAGELLIKWTQNGETDLAGYDIGFGLVNDANQFLYTRTMGPKAVITGTNNIVDAKIWGLDDNTQIFYGLRAHDISGNYSDWTPLQSATPWAVSPSAWSPVPGGLGEQAVVELAFPVPMDFDSLQDKLTVKDSTGSAVAGTTYYLTNVAGEAIGIGFQPNTPINGAASATLKGGANGVKAVDGRTMGGDYSWSFTLQAPVRAIYLPLVDR